MKALIPFCMILALASCQSSTDTKATVEQTVTDSVTSTPSEGNTIVLATGTKVRVTESHPIGASLSDIRIVAEGRTDTFLVRDADPVKTVLHADLDQDGQEEIYIHTSSAGSGSYGQIHALAIEGDSVFRSIRFPETDVQREVFKGYMGNDVFSTDGKTLIRTFPVYLPTDQASQPTGGTRTIRYRLLKKGRNWLLFEAND